MPKLSEEVGTSARTVPGVTDALRFTFGGMEARLAKLHGIAWERRTQFQARLRNFQRLGLLPKEGGGRGKVVLYGPAETVQMALALEFTQLGLLPERVLQIFESNKLQIAEAVTRAAGALIQNGGYAPESETAENPISFFLFFDPTGLAPLTQDYGPDYDRASRTFYYGSADDLKRYVAGWTIGPWMYRLSLVNVTQMMWGLVNDGPSDWQELFYGEAEAWADRVIEAVFMQHAEPPEPMDLIMFGEPGDFMENHECRAILEAMEPAKATALVEEAIRRRDARRKRMAEMTEQDEEDHIVEWAEAAGVPEYVMRTQLEASRPERRRVAKERREAREQKEPKNGDGN